MLAYTVIARPVNNISGWVTTFSVQNFQIKFPLNSKKKINRQGIISFSNLLERNAIPIPGTVSGKMGLFSVLFDILLMPKNLYVDCLWAWMWHVYISLKLVCPLTYGKCMLRFVKDKRKNPCWLDDWELLDARFFRQRNTVNDSGASKLYKRFLYNEILYIKSIKIH